MSSIKLSTPSIPNNLQSPLSRFIGREQELVKIASLLCTSRLLTLTGPGGTGKTRLALQIASSLLSEVDEFENGIYFVSLSHVSDPDLIISTIAQALGVSDPKDRSLLESLQAYLLGKRLLLVLDNFEQIVEGAPQVADLLRASEDLKVIVTSRTPLHVSGEQQYIIRPLPLPDLENLEDLESLSRVAAISLLVQRAANIKPDFALTQSNSKAIAEICHRLDGLPLAIELAAARMNVMTPHILLERLKEDFRVLTSPARDIPSRHQTLRAAIEWSDNLLDHHEKKLFRRMSVFVGGCTLEGAEAVCKASGDFEANVLDVIASLVDKSFLQQEEGTNGEARFMMLETIREYALEKLQESGEAPAVRQYHADYFLALAKTLNTDTNGPEQRRWLDGLRSEYGNIRAVLQWSLSDRVNPELGLRLAAELGWYWFIRGPLAEGRRWLMKAIALNRDNVSRRSEHTTQLKGIMAKALSAAGRLASKQGDYNQGETLIEESSVLRRDLGDQRGMAGILVQQGNLALQKGDLTKARSCFEESLTSWSKLKDNMGIADALSHLALAVWAQGDLERARSLMIESIRLQRERGDLGAAANVLQNLTAVALDQGEYRYASALVEESLKLAKELAIEPLIADAQMLRALLALRNGNYKRSRGQLTKCLRYYYEAGDKESIISCVKLSVDVALAAGESERKSAHPISRGVITTAAKLLGGIYSLRAVRGTDLPPVTDKDLESTIASVRVRLDENEFQYAWKEGQMMTTEQVIAMSLDLNLLFNAERDEPPQVHAPLPLSNSKQVRYPEGLTRREVEVLQVVAQGLSNAQIAERLFLSPNTVNVHLYSIYSKLGVNSRSAATRFAFEHKLN